MKTKPKAMLIPLSPAALEALRHKARPSKEAKAVEAEIEKGRRELERWEAGRGA